MRVRQFKGVHTACRLTRHVGTLTHSTYYHRHHGYCHRLGIERALSPRLRGFVKACILPKVGIGTEVCSPVSRVLPFRQEPQAMPLLQRTVFFGRTRMLHIPAICSLLVGKRTNEGYLSLSSATAEGCLRSSEARRSRRQCRVLYGGVRANRHPFGTLGVAVDVGILEKSEAAFRFEHHAGRRCLSPPCHLTLFQRFRQGVDEALRHHLHVGSGLQRHDGYRLVVAHSVYGHLLDRGVVGDDEALETQRLRSMSVTIQRFAVAGMPSMRLNEVVMPPTPAFTAAS